MSVPERRGARPAPRLAAMTVAAIVLAAVAARAQYPPEPSLSSVAIATAEPVSLFVLPDGGGATLASACGFGGATVDATIRVTLIGIFGDPVHNVQPAEVWLAPSDGGGVFCPLAYPAGTWPGYTHHADGPSDYDGLMTFSSACYGGGRTDPEAGEVVFVVTAWGAIWPPLDIRINSADIDGDLAVTLSDVVLFAGDIYGAYDYRSDFHWDGVIDLSDVILMAQALGAACP